MTTKRAPAAPRRPQDRKTQILAAAVEHFHRSGYGATSMEDIAVAVGITPGALYRHFRNKNELLVRALGGGLDMLRDAMDRADGLDGMLRAIGAFFLDHRGYPLLWDREASLLPEEPRLAIRDRHREIVSRVAAAVGEGRPELTGAETELVALAAASVLASPSYHHTSLPRPRFEALLYEQASAVCRTSVLPRPGADAHPTGAAPPPTAGPRLTTLSRREALLIAGARLFTERGFPSVNMEQIGAAAGISGPSVYKHFASKAELLLAVMARERAVLNFSLSWAVTESVTAGEALERVLRSYVTIVESRCGPVGLGVSDLSHLPPGDEQAFRRAQQDYVAEWVALTTAARPDLREAEARVTTHSAFTLIRGVSRTSRLEAPAPPEAVIGMALDVLGVDPSR
ncbi:TetR/AcrR family transcriptional regulator [Streptomyces sp. NPDC055078]